LSSADDQPAQFRCPGCPNLRIEKCDDDSGASVDSEPESWSETQLLDRVDRLRQERNAGRAVYELLTPIEWEAMLIWDETIEDFKRGHQIRIEQMFQMMVSIIVQR